MFTQSSPNLPDKYYQLTRNCIVRRDIIADLEPQPLEHKLTIILKEPFKDRIKLASDIIAPFEGWYYKNAPAT